MLSTVYHLQELQLDLERLRKLNYKLKKSAELEKARLPASPEPLSTSPEIPHSHSDLAAVDEESHCSILQEELEQVGISCIMHSYKLIVLYCWTGDI